MTGQARVPQVLVTLSPEGELQIELPSRGVDGSYQSPTTRKLRITEREAGERLLRLLREQARKIAESAEQAWDNPDRPKRRVRAQRSKDYVVIAKHPGVEIRQIMPRGKAAKRQKVTSKSLEELGL